MNKNIAKKWIKALKSGKYKQGRSYLKQFNSKGQPQHCCLGVLCELYNETMKKNHKKTLSTKTCDDSYDTPNGYVKFGNKGGSLPLAVRKWAEIKNELGVFDIFKKDDYGDTILYCDSLADLNDHGSRFSTIANIIGKNVENI